MAPEPIYGLAVIGLCRPDQVRRNADAKPDDVLILTKAIGVINQKCADVEGCDDVEARIRHAIDLFGAERVLLHPDCGFATFADNPICAAVPAETKLARITEAVRHMRKA